MTYYFLAASLPGLSLDAAPPMSLQDFLSTCEEHLTAEDFSALQAVLDGNRQFGGSPFVREWFARDTQLRNAVVHARAARLKQDAAPYCQPFEGFDSAIEDAVAEAFSRPSPLERERMFDDVRWQVIEDLAGVDMFSPEAILSYGLKLQIIERWAGLDESEGMARLEASLKDRADETPSQNAEATETETSVA